MTDTTTINNNNTTKLSILNRLLPDQVGLEIKDAVDPIALEQAKNIMKELRCTNKNSRGAVRSSKLLQVAQKLGDISLESTTFLISPVTCKEAYDQLNDLERCTLNNIYERVKHFAIQQRESLHDMTTTIPGGQAGHTVSPCSAAGCYAPGGRYPLPSSVLMTAVTARAAGCPRVILASPRPAPITLAAAHLAGVDYFLCVGGAQAIAAMAYGVINDDEDDTNTTTESSPTILVPRCDVICGPGNKWVTAAKSIVNGYCGIDMLAGPSEVLVICDGNANARTVAADLIAQAEHDVVARAILLSTDASMIDKIDEEIVKQIAALPEPNQSTARSALEQSFAVCCTDLDQCVQLSDTIAPEHLEIQTGLTSQSIANQCQHYGGLFIGEHAAEVLGDYGAGPNHTLPTGGTGRYTGGLSVFHFLRIRTWMRIDNPKNVEQQQMVQDSIIMARLEGLEGHARAAEQRIL